MEGEFEAYLLHIHALYRQNIRISYWKEPAFFIEYDFAVSVIIDDENSFVNMNIQKLVK